MKSTHGRKVARTVNKHVARDGGDRGSVRYGVLELGMMFLKVGLQHPLGCSSLHHHIPASLVYFQDPVHTLHVKNDSALKRPGKPG
ncbi:hypothetical protein ES703_118317 [subsurface metagenome]